MSEQNKNLFNSEFAVNQFSGNKALLIQMLEKFVEQYQGFEKQLIQLIQRQDIKLAKQQVHTIKGVSGNLGMSDLHAASRNLERQFPDVNLQDPHLTDFLNIVVKTLDTVSQFMQQGSHEDKPEAATTASKSDKQLLIDALKRNEFISEGKMQIYKNSLELEKNKLEMVVKAIDDLNYPTAIKILNE